MVVDEVVMGEWWWWMVIVKGDGVNRDSEIMVMGECSGSPQLWYMMHLALDLFPQVAPLEEKS